MSGYARFQSDPCRRGARAALTNLQPALYHRQWRQRVDVGEDVDHHRPVRLERLRERARDLARLLDADAYRAHVLGKAREVHLVEGPQRAAALGLLAAIDAVEAALRLVAAAVVVHDRDRIDLPAHGGLDLGDVIPEASVARERNDRPLRH